MGEYFDAQGNPVSEDDLRAEFGSDKLRAEFEKQIKASNAAIKDLEADAAAWRTQQHQAAVSEILGPLGDQAVKVWTALKPGEAPTPESAAAFAEEFNFAQAKPAEPPASPSTPAAAAQSFTFTPTVPTDGQPAGQKISMAEYSTLMRTDPGRAKSYFNAGMVEFSPEVLAGLRTK
jgi:hypothetical protein